MNVQYNTIQIHVAPKAASESEALPGSEPCRVLYAAENNVVFKWDLKVASEDVEWRSSS